MAMNPFTKMKMGWLEKGSWVFSLILLGNPLWGYSATPKGNTPAEQGLHIFVTQDEMDMGFRDSQVTMKMTLINAAGLESQRKMVMLVREFQGEGDKTLITFKFPRDIKGTGLLTYEHLDTADDQWLYLPALKRVKRIASANKTGSFVGSEFSYEDISSHQPEKYTYRYLREDLDNGIPVWVIDQYPKDLKSGYTKIITWVDQSNYQTVKQEYFDRRGVLFKVEHDSGHTQELGKFWRPNRITMDNVNTKKKTILEFHEWVFQQGLDDAVFTTRALERQR